MDRIAAKTGGRQYTKAATSIVAAALLAMLVALPVPVEAQGWWWGSPINPGFDRNAVIKVTGTATQIDIVSGGGPSTLRLETAGETFTVVLGPGWYLGELRVDLRSGDTLQVEGSKMKSRRGQLYLVAARILNQRTGALIELRDELGRPRWKDSPPPR
ncbi:MAG: hypothetical protein HYV04_13450 [Deltaproteobacteria bacterium]|nr:hypothetical protein [Deltaproteobacteria bacterium]